MTNEIELLQHEQEYAQSDISFKDMMALQQNQMLNFFPKLIRDLIKEGFPIRSELEKGYFAIADFYKSQELRLVPDANNNFIAFDKEGNKGIVDSIEKIVELNFYWWVSSQTKQGYPAMTKKWNEEFLKRKWLKIVRIYTPDMDAFENATKIEVKKDGLGEKNQEDKELEAKIQNVNLEDDEDLKELEKLTNPNFKSEEEDFNL